MRKTYTHGDIVMAGGEYRTEIYAHSWNSGGGESMERVSTVCGPTEVETRWEAQHEVLRLQKIENKRHEAHGGFRA